MNLPNTSPTDGLALDALHPHPCDTPLRTLDRDTGRWFGSTLDRPAVTTHAIAVDSDYAHALIGEAMTAADAENLPVLVTSVGCLLAEMTPSSWPKVDDIARWHRLAVAAAERRILLTTSTRLARAAATRLAAIRNRLNDVAPQEAPR